MKILVKNRAKLDKFLKLAEGTASLSTCKNAKNGTIIVKNNTVIGRGFNSPPLDKEKFLTCLDSYPDPLAKKKFDRTCCVHAEWRAVFDALRNNPDKIMGSEAFFVRLSKNGKPEKLDRPFCTVCSCVLLDTGVKKFITLHIRGIAEYATRT